MCSDRALKLYAVKKEGIIKTNAQFWREFGGTEKLDGLNIRTEKYAREIRESDVDLVCAFDENFPPVPENLKPSERPCLFAYRGNISLLNDRVKNVAVVGTINPDSTIIEREKAVVGKLVERGLNIVSGLAVGCDTAAHRQCLLKNGKTIAFLPCVLGKVYPKANVKLAADIVASGGLIITEYVTEAKTKYQSVGRFIERDRLQAMFAESIILVASNLPEQGDSGSRHAMAKAAAYNVKRFVMYNELTDRENALFGLNRKLVKEGAAVLTLKEFNNFYM